MKYPGTTLPAYQKKKQPDLKGNPAHKDKVVLGELNPLFV